MHVILALQEDVNIILINIYFLWVWLFVLLCLFVSFCVSVSWIHEWMKNIWTTITMKSIIKIITLMFFSYSKPD